MIQKDEIYCKNCASSINMLFLVVRHLIGLGSFYSYFYQIMSQVKK